MDGYLVAGAIVVASVVLVVWLAPRRPYRGRRGVRWRRPARPDSDTGERPSLDQLLELIASTPTERRPVQNEGEDHLFAAIEAELSRTTCRVHPQVPLSQMVQGRGGRDFPPLSRWYLQRRPDMVVVDQRGRPLVAIEYDGPGHYGETNWDRQRTEESDRLKAALLERAGIGLLRIRKGWSRRQLASQLRAHLPG